MTHRQPIVLFSVYSNDSAVREKCLKFLYEMLKERKPWQNISHKETPTWENHVKFVESKPYKEWFIVMNRQGEWLGNLYLSKYDEIGIFLLDKYQHMGYGSQMLDALYQYFDKIEIFATNCSPLNSSSQAFFANKGFKWGKTTTDEHGNLVQHTFYKANPYYAGSESSGP